MDHDNKNFTFMILILKLHPCCRTKVKVIKSFYWTDYLLKMLASSTWILPFITVTSGQILYSKMPGLSIEILSGWGPK